MTEGDSRSAIAFTELQTGLMFLRRAYDYAQDSGVDRWEFAVEIDQLFRFGWSANDVRWLLAKGYAQHGQESPLCGRVHRTFEINRGLKLSAADVLVLTSTGANFTESIGIHSFGVCRSRTISDVGLKAESDSGALTNGNNSIAVAKPTWDYQRRELQYRGQVVKRYRVPATSQETILCAFEEEAWPPFIDDPLPLIADGVPKQRLQNAIKRLNVNQKNQLIRFHGNGNGARRCHFREI